MLQKKCTLKQNINFSEKSAIFTKKCKLSRKSTISNPPPHVKFTEKVQILHFKKC